MPHSPRNMYLSLPTRARMMRTCLVHPIWVPLLDLLSGLVFIVLGYPDRSASFYFALLVEGSQVVHYCSVGDLGIVHTCVSGCALRCTLRAISTVWQDDCPYFDECRSDFQGESS